MSHEVNSQEKTFIMERVLSVAFVVLSSISNSRSGMEMVILFVFNVTLVKLEEAAKYLRNKRKEINHEGEIDLELSYASPARGIRERLLPLYPSS